jgi:hypothetical protein
MDEVPRSFPSAQEVRNRLTIPNGESRWVLLKFLESMCARAVRDIAINFREEFVQHWMLQNEGVYGGWYQLEYMCRLWEDLDLNYTGIELRKFRNNRIIYVLYLCVL